MKKAKERFSHYLHRRYGDRSTPKHYLNDIDMFIQIIGAKKPSKITSQDIDAFITAQAEKGLAASTINRRLASLHSFFEYLASEDEAEIGINPVKWKRHRVSEGSYLPRDASDQTVRQLFEVIDKARDRALFGLMVGAGLRVGEVARLKCTDLTPPPLVTECARLRVCGKGQKERFVWVTPRWYGELIPWLAQRESNSEYLFVSQRQTPLSVAGIQYCLKQYAATAGIELTCHQLRHTFARRLAEQKMPTESISLLLGHAKISTTQRYTAGANPELRDAFLAAMNAAEEQTVVSTMLPMTQGRTPCQEKRDPQLLQEALTTLDCLPNWLLPPVRNLVCRRWRNWQPHTAAKLVVQLRNNLLRHWQWLIAEYDLTGWSDLQRVHLEEWMQSRFEAGLKAKTVHTDFSLLKACLLEAVELGLPVSAQLLRIKSPQLPSLLPRFLAPDDFQKLQQTVYQETEVATVEAALDRAWFLTLCHTGIRCGELVNIRMADLDFSQRRLFIDSGKNGDERVVYLTPPLLAALARYLALRPQSSDDHLWLLPNGSVLLAAQVNYRLTKWGETCSVHVSPHRLRHTFATQLINQGMPLASVAKLLGHRRLDMTQHYARLYDETVKVQFESAAAHIDGILAVAWPQAPLSESIKTPIKVFT